jgi:hypothetical protein
MKLIVSGDAPAPEVAAQFPLVQHAPTPDDQEVVDAQGWHLPRTIVEVGRDRWKLHEAATGSHVVVDQEGILMRALGVVHGYGQWRDDDPRDDDRMVWCARQVVLTFKKFFPTLKLSHWCSVVNAPYLFGRLATAEDMFIASQKTERLRQACDVVETSVYPYDKELTAGAWINEAWIKASVHTALKLSPDRPVMVTITNRWNDMTRYSREFLANAVKWIRAEFAMQGTRKDRVDIINLWTADTYFYKIATGEVNVEWWPGHKQQCIDAFLSPGAPTPAETMAEDLQVITEAAA